MKKYILFSGAHYYPGGGMRDLSGSFDSIQEAIDFANRRDSAGSLRDEWYEVVDRDTWVIVAKS